jgi:hypothetical protein
MSNQIRAVLYAVSVLALVVVIAGAVTWLFVAGAGDSLLAVLIISCLGWLGWALYRIRLDQLDIGSNND